MSKEKLPILAVIPAHNAARSLPTLLEELIKQHYDQIIVIDDASTDDTAKVVRSYRPKVELIEGRENVGSGANRNRIIGKVDSSVLHFIDADMKLLSKNTPDIIRNLHWPKNTAYIGGLIRNPKGEQNPFNYGPRPSVTAYISGAIQTGIWLIGYRYQKIAKFLRSLVGPFVRAWPKIYHQPSSRPVSWTAESNMIIKSQMFEKLGGYDPNFRYGEIDDFATRIRRLGLKIFFEPKIDALHATTDNIYKRKREKFEAHKQFLKKYGYLVVYLPVLADFIEGLKTQKRYHK